MRKLEMKAKYVIQTNYTIAPNLIYSEFEVTDINKVWVCGITCIALDRGWLYDLFNRQVVGWQMSHRINLYLMNDALKVALLTKGSPNG